MSNIESRVMDFAEKSLDDLNIRVDDLGAVSVEQFLGMYIHQNPKEIATHVDTPTGNTIDISDAWEWCYVKRDKGVHFGDCREIKHAVKRQEWLLKTFFEDYFKRMCLGLVVDEPHKKNHGFIVENLELVCEYNISRWLVVCENPREVVLCLPMSMKYIRG